MKSFKLMLAGAAIALPLAAFAATNPATPAAPAKPVVNAATVPAPAQSHTARKAAKATCQKQLGPQSGTHAQIKSAQSTCEKN
jgi:hypothetical protein